MKQSGPPGAIVAAGIVGILASLFAILIAVASIAGMFMLPPNNSAAIPPFAKPLAIAMTFLLGGLAVFGIFTSLGVLRLKRWARVSMLVWGGLMAAFSGVMLLFTSLVPLPDVYAADTAVSSQYIRILISAVYGIPFLIGIWWLLLFNQSAVKERFLAGAIVEGQLVSNPQPRCPLPLAILAGFTIFSAGFSLLLPFTNFPVNPILFGYRFQGVFGVVLFYLSAGLVLAGAIGMLRLKRWSYPLMLAQYFFWMASGTITLVRPNYDLNLHQMLAQMNLPEGQMGQAAIAQTRVFGVLSLIPGVLLIWLMLYFHTRFVEACAAKETQLST
jgi:hypothetical protein